VDGRPWQRAHPEELERLEEELDTAFPDLHVVERGETIFVAGVIPLVHAGRVDDRYKIEIAIPRTYPKGLFVVHETGGRIPKKDYRHVSADGSLCVLVPDEFWYAHPTGMSLVDFINGPLLGYLAGQSLVERGLPWPQGDRPHGGDGIADFYGEILGTKDRGVIIAYVEALAAKKLRGQWACPCGNGEKVRDCHRAQLDDLRSRIPRKVARYSLDQLKKAP
jgi:hypothetical protein